MENLNRPLLINKEDQNELDKEGFLIIPNFLNNNIVDRVFELYEKHFNPEKTSDPHYWNSLWNLPIKQKEDLNEELLSILKPIIKNHFSNYEILVITIMVKLIGEKNVCEPHRDFSILNEIKNEYYNAWIPLIDINKENAPLFLLPKSHIYFNEVLPMLTKWPYDDFREEIKNEVLTIYPKKGDLVIYKEKTVHGSWGNFSGKPRPNLHFGILPKKPEIMYYKYGKTNEIEGYLVNQEFYFGGKESFEEKLQNIELKQKIEIPSSYNSFKNYKDNF